MANKKQYHLTSEQAETAIKLCLDNARTYLEDADMYISNNRTEHLAIPIEFAMEEIGKAKIIYDKLQNNSSKILLSEKEDAIYSHPIKLKKAISLIEVDIGESLGEEMIKNQILFGEFSGLDFSFNSEIISDTIKKETELKNTGKQGHNIRLASSFVDFDPVTNESKIKKNSVDLHILLENLYEILNTYPSSFNTN